MGAHELELVRRCFEAWDRGDVEGVVAGYAPDVEYDGSDIADGVYGGAADVRAHYEEIFDAFVFTHDRVRFLDAGDSVVVLSTLRARGSRSGASVEGPLAYVFELRDGQVARLRLYREQGDALRDAGLTEPDALNGSGPRAGG